MPDFFSQLQTVLSKSFANFWRSIGHFFGTYGIRPRKIMINTEMEQQKTTVAAISE